MDTPPLAPASTDDNVVILWVVLVLVAAVILVGKVLWAKIQENEKRMQDEIAKANARAEAANAKLLEVHGSVVMDQQKTQLGANAAMNRMADVAEKMTVLVEKKLDKHGIEIK
jgi:F0F1-type ATP synthase membrane subunit b/b'